MDRTWLKHYPKGVAPHIDIPPNKTIVDHFQDSVKRFGDKPALSCMGTTISFRQLDRLSDRFASYLQNVVGLKKGDRLAIMLPNIIQFPVAFLGAQKIGVICVNTNPLYTPREMKHQFEDSGCVALIIMDMFIDKLEKILHETKIKTVISTAIGDQMPAWKGFVVNQVLKFKGQIPKHNLTVMPFREALKHGDGKPFNRPHVDLDDVAILQYTGGTTGLSKGAMLTQRNILANGSQIQAWARTLLVDGEETVMTAIPLYHVFALSVNFLAFLNMGSHSILVPKPVPIDNLVAVFKKYKITALTGVNTLFNALNNNKNFQALAPKSIKIALAGATALQENVSKSWQRITGVSIMQGFGLTEASPVTHCVPIVGESPLGSIGLPLPSTEAKIVDEQGNEVPHGEPGELLVKGPQVMKGYWNKPDDTAKSIKDGWLWTGDMAKRDENGYFFIVDRKKDMILVSGFNVYPNEVEAVLASHPKVLEAAVVGVPDAGSGESVKAFVVKKDESCTAEELREYCKDQLTNYKRPRSYEFRKELPKTNVGKILRRELRDNK